MSDDDDVLWEKLTETVKPLKKRNIFHGRAKIALTRIVKHTVVREVRLPSVQIKQTPPSPIPSRQAKKLQQHKIPVEASIDLHGMTIERAQNAIMRFLTNAWHNELRCVEIVTGRGDPHRGTGQLKRLVPFWLDDPQLRHLILHVTQNPVSRGGSLLVLLRRNRAGD